MLFSERPVAVITQPLRDRVQAPGEALFRGRALANLAGFSEEQVGRVWGADLYGLSIGYMHNRQPVQAESA